VRIAIALLPALAGVALATGQVPAWLPPEGEKLTYALSYLHVVAGTMELAAQATGEGVRLSMVATSTPAFSRIFTVNNRIETLLRPNPLSLLSQHASIAEGKRRFEETVVVEPERQLARRFRDGQEKNSVAVPDPVLDTLGAIFALRTLDLAPSRAFALNVLSGKGVYPLLVVVTGRATVKLAPGKTESYVVEPRFRQGGLLKSESKLTLYVSTDGRHVPLRIVSQLPFGSISATLQAASPPHPPAGAIMNERDTEVNEHGTETR